MKRMKRLLSTPMITSVTMSPRADARGVAMLSARSVSIPFTEEGDREAHLDSLGTDDIE
jgi:hypothetical protein